ncbi:hypothetical protein ACFSTD_00055 [Novosphingobium colocasiae]
MARKVHGTNQASQGPADPEVFLDYDRREIPTSRRFLDIGAAILGGTAGEFIHGAPPESSGQCHPSSPA